MLILMDRYPEYVRLGEKAPDGPATRGGCVGRTGGCLRVGGKLCQSTVSLIEGIWTESTTWYSESTATTLLPAT